MLENVHSIRIPEGKSFAFVEFRTPAAAAKVVSDLEDFPLSIAGKPLSVGWAKGQPAESSSHAAECWFCLASESVKTHLIVSVGEAVYVALPRGFHSLYIYA